MWKKSQILYLLPKVHRILAGNHPFTYLIPGRFKKKIRAEAEKYSFMLKFFNFGCLFLWLMPFWRTEVLMTHQKLSGGQIIKTVWVYIGKCMLSSWTQRVWQTLVTSLISLRTCQPVLCVGKAGSEQLGETAEAGERKRVRALGSALSWAPCSILWFPPTSASSQDNYK